MNISTWNTEWKNKMDGVINRLEQMNVSISFSTETEKKAEEYKNW